MIFEMWNSAFQRSAAPVARGEGLRSIERLALDRKTVRRYIGAATESGLGRGSSEADLDDAFMAKVGELARPRRPDGHR